MQRRIALISLVLAGTAAAGIFAADHLGVQLPWDLASTTSVGPGSKDREPAVSAEEVRPEADAAGEAAVTAEPAEKTAETVIEETVAALADDAAKSPEPESGSVALDISRISPQGPSVFAGRAEPGSYVTVFEDGKPAGTVQADSGGSWSLSTEHKFASADPKITFEASPTPPPAPAPEPPAPAAETAAAEESPPAAATAEKEDPATSAPAAAGDVMRKFEELVAEAREDAAREEAEAEARERAQAATRAAIEAQKKAEAETAGRETVVAARPDTPAPPEPEKAPETAPQEEPRAAAEAETETAPEARASASASADAVPGATSTVDGEPAKAEPETKTAVVAAPGRSATPEAAIPVPIMFVYNEATLTPEGERAADLLLEYLLLKRLDSVELTGHADERGTHAYNFDLSRERLETVSRILQEGGYKGELKLTPKGKTEPFKGIDRSKYRGEALYQFDRRVELRVTR